MAHWKDVPEGLQARLEKIAALLDEARDVRHSFDQLGDVKRESRASDEILWAKARLGDDSTALRLHRLVQVWGVVAGEMLAGIAALCRQSEVVVAHLPLVRSTLEYCNRIVWVLDHRPDVLPQMRFARVLLEELLSAEETCKAASHLAGRGSHPHLEAREERMDARRRAQILDPDAVVTGSPRDWTIAGERLLSPTESAVNFGEMWGDPRLSEGVYDALSAYSHPTLLALDFYKPVGGRSALNTDQATIEKFVSHAVIPYYQALRHHLAYNGWRSDHFDAWEAQLMEAFPGMIQ